MAKQWTAQELFGISGAYWAGSALQTAVRLDLFTVLENGPLEDAVLAQKLGCSERGLGMLLTALSAMKLIVRSNGTAAAANGTLPLLSASSPDYIGFIIKHHANIMPAWTQLEDAVRKGSRAAPQNSSHTMDEQEREAFLMGMFNVARLQAETVADALDLSGRRRLLDVGGGPGTYALYFCRANPHLRATIFDLPTTEPFARKTVERMGMAGRVGFAGGNFMESPLPEGHDVAWLSQVLHGQSPEEAAELIKRSAAVLEPGGMVCVQEFMLHNDRQGPQHAALFSLNMLVQTQSGQSYTENEIAEMLKNAGAVTVRALNIYLPMDCRILIGQLA